METKSYKEYLEQITTFIFDVDGVLTNGDIIVTTDGDMYRTMNTKDGFALKTAIDAGFRVCIISGGSNAGVKARLERLGIKHIYLGVHDKINTYIKILAEEQITSNEVLYMGDDIPDYPVMKEVALPTCPQDAVNEIKSVSKYISHKNGGRGAVRDVIEQVLKVHGKWNSDFNAKYD